jgi:hypothetical protein
MEQEEESIKLESSRMNSKFQLTSGARLLELLNSCMPPASTRGHWPLGGGSAPLDGARGRALRVAVRPASRPAATLVPARMSVSETGSSGGPKGPPGRQPTALHLTFSPARYRDHEPTKQLLPPDHHTDHSTYGRDSFVRASRFGSPRGQENDHHFLGHVLLDRSCAV